MDQHRIAAVGPQARVDDAAVGRVSALQDHRAGTVAEQDGGVALRVVGHPAEGIDADHQGVFVMAQLHQTVSDREPVEEATAGGHDVESGGGAVADAQAHLQVTGGAGQSFSGLQVATMIRSSWSGASRARSRAWRAASNAMLPEFSQSSAIRRSRTPVRARIHSSLVSTICIR